MSRAGGNVSTPAGGARRRDSRRAVAGELARRALPAPSERRRTRRSRPAPRGARAGRRGTRSSSPASTRADEARERPQPVARGRQDAMRDAERRQGLAPRRRARPRPPRRSAHGACDRRCRREAAAPSRDRQASARRRSAAPPPGVADLDRHHLVPSGEHRAAAAASREGRESRRRARRSERCWASVPMCAAARRRTTWGRPAAPPARVEARAEGRGGLPGPGAGAAPPGASSPNVTTPRRLPRRVAT